MALKELRLPALESEEAKAWNALLMQAGRRTFAFAGQDWRLSVRAHDAGAMAPMDALSLSLRMDGHPVALLAPPHLFDQCLSCLSSGQPARAIPETLALALFEVLFSELATLCSSLLGRTLQFAPSAWNGTPPELPFALDWSLENGEGEPAHGLLLASSGALLPLADLLGLTHAAAGASWCDDLSGSLHWTFSGPLLTLQELQSLVAGDIVLMPAGSDPEHPLLVSGHRVCARLRREQDHFIVDEVFSMSKDHPEPPIEVGTLDDLPVAVAFDLGEARLSYAELRALKPGHILESGRDLKTGTVRLTANGAIIGEGSLVDIEGRLGVMVSRIFSAAGESR